MAFPVNIEDSHINEFSELLSIIQMHRSAASQAVNQQQLLSAWSVGGYVSTKLKTQQWGSKVVSQFVEYVKVNAPDLRGYSRRNIYNMVMFYDEYSSPEFMGILSTYLPDTIVQTVSAQLQGGTDNKIEDIVVEDVEFVQTATAQIVQSPTGQLPKILTLTTLSNHIAILNECKTAEERLFYVLYANREKLSYRELQRCISNGTYASLLGTKRNLSKGMLDTYPQAPVIFKDTTYVDFLGLPKRHSEPKLRKGIVAHMKEFILELGKDFIFMGEEYPLEVGGKTYHVDLLFFHRGLQALCAFELKRTPFQPRDLGQLEFYLEALDRDVKRTNENPSVGILLCPEANQTVVEYALSRSMSPTMVAEYKRLLIPKEKMQSLLQEYCEYLNLQ